MKTLEYERSTLPYALGDVHDIQEDREMNNRWLIAHGEQISFANVDSDKFKMSRLTKLVSHRI